MLRREKEKASVSSLSSACLYLKPSYSAEVDAKSYLERFAVPQFQKFDSRRGYTREYVVRFLDSMNAFAHNANVYMREFSKSLIDSTHLICQHKAKIHTLLGVSRVTVQYKVFLASSQVFS